MTPLVPKGQFRVTLTWPDSPSDLDIYSYFRSSTNTVCTVFFGGRYCNEVSSSADNNKGGRKGSETITIELLQNFIYTFVARKYIDKSDNGHLKEEKRVNGSPLFHYSKPENLTDVNIDKSKARISLFASGFSQKLFEFFIPDNIAEGNLLYPEDEKGHEEKEFNWWLGFCLDGSQGVDSIKIVNKLSIKDPLFTYCESLYFKKGYDFPTPKPDNWNKTENSLEVAEVKPAFIEFEIDDENKIRKINQFEKYPNVNN